MAENISLPDRLKQLVDHYGLTVNELANKIGGSRMKFYNLMKGSSKPDYETTEGILKNFPEVSAEWFMRGEGPMLKKQIISSEEANAIMAENKAIKAMYRAELLAKHKGAYFGPDTAQFHKKASANETINRVRKADRKRVIKQTSVRVPGAKIPTLVDLFN